MCDLCFSHGTPYGHEHGWDIVEQMRDGEVVRNVENLQRGLLVRVAASIPSYWFGIMSPSTTAAAADVRITHTTSLFVRREYDRGLTFSGHKGLVSHSFL